MHGARNELFPLNASTTTSADLAARTASSINEHGAAPVRAITVASGIRLRIASCDSTTKRIAHHQHPRTCNGPSRGRLARTRRDECQHDRQQHAVSNTQ
jgi:hypothetical protein